MSSPHPVPQVTVRGEAVLSVEPEVADLVVTVRVRARDRHTALQRVAAGQDAVADVLAGAEEAVESVESTGVAVHPAPSDSGLPDVMASISSRVTVGRLDAVGDLVAALGELDDVEVSGPYWRLRPQSPAIEQARMAAVDDAVHRARQYAAAFGSRLTELLAVSDVGLSGEAPRFAAPMAAVARFESSEPHLDLAPARQDVHGAVEVRFAMSQPDREVFGG
jgi:uncharacterized protein